MRHNKILLVSPGIHKGKHRLALHPHAGLGYVAESLIKAGFTVKVFDMNLRYDQKDLFALINDFSPDIIGFTLMTFAHKEVYGLIGKIKNLYRKVRIVAGGPHVSTLREKVLADCPGIDYGIILEGDISAVELCRGADFNNIQGLIYRRGDEIIVNDFNHFITELDEAPFPKYESFELDKYPVRQIGIVTSRGCPYECIYCPVASTIGKQFRARSAENVVEEIAYWYKNGYREIFVLDDNFTLSEKRTARICELLKKNDFRDIHLKCPNGIRADKVDYALLKSMREAGFDMIAFGVEAGSDRVLKNIKKGEDILKIEAGIRNACSLGFDVELFFIIGSPGERLTDVEASFSLATRYPVRGAEFYNIVPFPKTELFEWIRDNKYFLKSIDYILNSASHFVNEPYFFTPEMSASDRKKAFRMGRNVTRKIRRAFIERRMIAPPALRRFISWLYTIPSIERALINNRSLLKLKTRLKGLFMR